MIYLVAILLYLLFLVGVGVYKSRQVKTGDDFAVAGRTLSPWVTVLTMLAVWIGTGSIVGAAEQTYKTGLNAMFLPVGTLFGMLILTRIAGRARGYEVYTVPEIIGARYGGAARMLAVVSLIIAYMVIVSYQFNAGGAVLEVIGGEKEAVILQEGDEITLRQINKGFVRFMPDKDFKGVSILGLSPKKDDRWSEKPVAISVAIVPREEILKQKEEASGIKNMLLIKKGDFAKYGMADLSDEITGSKRFKVLSLPLGGQLVLVNPKLTAQQATVIAAIFIIIFTMIAGMKSLASCDTYNGSLIIIALVIAFPVLLYKAGGFAGMAQKFAEMGDKPNHMDLFGTFKPLDYINWLLPTFLLVMGDANQYQRFFSSRNVKGAKQAAYILVAVAIVIELLIIACAWVAGSMTADPANGQYILIYAARHYMPMALGLVFMVTVVAIIISTADSFLLVPATTFMRDVYMKYINPNVNEKKVLIVSRFLVIVFGIIAYLVSLMFAESTGFFKKAMLAYTIYGAAITPCLVAAMFWKRVTKSGAITSIIAGVSSTILWNEVFKGMKGMPEFFSDMDAVLPAITVSVASLVIVSLATYDKDKVTRLEQKTV